MSKSKSKTQHHIRDVRPKIRLMYIGQETADEVAKALLSSGWDFVDPVGSMRKPSDEVREFLKGTTVQVALFSHLTEGRQALLKTCCDAYSRSLAEHAEAA